MWKSKKNIVISIIIFVVVIILFLLGGMLYSENRKVQSLYTMMDIYYKGQELMLPNKGTFAQDSPEATLVKGMVFYEQENYQEANACFQQALVSLKKNKFLAGYLYYYMNSCEYCINSVGNIDNMELALSSIGRYRPLSNNTELIMDMIDTILPLEDSYSRAIILLQDYLDNISSLSALSQARIGNMIGKLQYLNMDYTKSLKTFYDVEMILEQQDRTPEMESELVYAKEFIASIYYLFHDDREAMKIYRDIIDFSNDYGYFYPYISQLNLITLYLENGEIEEARKNLDILEKNIQCDEEDFKELEACVFDAYANLSILEKQFDVAEIYLEKAEAYYRNNDSSSDLVLGGDVYIMLTRCKYLFYTGNYQQAQEILETMLADGCAVDLDMKKDMYELLQQIYQLTGQINKLIVSQEELLRLDDDYQKIIQKEYLVFSNYYKENKKLMHYIENMKRRNGLSILIIAVAIFNVIILVMLCLFLAKRAITDSLTKTSNRKRLNWYIKRFQKKELPSRLGVVMLDIDYFKLYNDSYGHPAGDVVLKNIAKAIMSAAGKNSSVIRYGGEEFLILLPNRSQNEVEHICSNIQYFVGKLAIPHKESKAAKNVTVSIGLLYQSNPGTDSLEQLIKKADECLYESKEAGRNRITTKII